jgi:hypothetical protein
MWFDAPAGAESIDNAATACVGGARDRLAENRVGARQQRLAEEAQLARRGRRSRGPRLAVAPALQREHPVTAGVI